MLKPLSPRTALTLLWSALTIFCAACSKEPKAIQISQNLTQKSDASVPPVANSESSVVKDSSAQQPNSEPAEEESMEPTPFEMGLDKASGGFSISQSAQSPEDWQLVAEYYQDAMDLMKSVDAGSRYYPIAKVKVREYQHHFDSALEKSVALQQPKPKAEPERIVVTVPPLKESITRQKMQVPPAVKKILQQNLQSPIAKLPEQLPEKLPEKLPEQLPQLSQAPPQSRQPIQIPIETKEVYAAIPVPQATRQAMTFSAPIKRRIGGTPIIEVTFNGKHKFEMIVDTGASGTVITQRMAKLLDVTTVGKAKANTASAQSVEFPIGYVDSIEAGGVKVRRVAVAIAGSELQNGLLGHDFFGNYDITIKRNVVEFFPRNNPSITQKSIPIYPKKLFKD